jgi:hypothetical protein
VDAIWESARLSYNGGNNRGSGIDRGLRTRGGA